MKLVSLAFCGVAVFSGWTKAGLIRRADSSEVASVGYASTNGGTTGGRGGSVITVSTLSALKSAVSGSSAATVIVSGTISGNEAVKVGSNKSILGKDSNASRSKHVLLQQHS
jgi:pectate lyase